MPAENENTAQKGIESPTQPKASLLPKTRAMILAGQELPRLPGLTQQFVTEVIARNIDQMDISVLLPRTRYNNRMTTPFPDYLKDLDTYLTTDQSSASMTQIGRAVDPRTMREQIQSTLSILRKALIESYDSEEERMIKGFMYNDLSSRIMTEQGNQSMRRALQVPTGPGYGHERNHGLKTAIEEEKIVSEALAQGISVAEIIANYQQYNFYRERIVYLRDRKMARDEFNLNMTEEETKIRDEGLVSLRERIANGTFFHGNYVAYCFLRDVITYNLDQRIVDEEWRWELRTYRDLGNLLQTFDLVMGMGRKVADANILLNIVPQAVKFRIETLTSMFLELLPSNIAERYKELDLMIPGQESTRLQTPPPELQKAAKAAYKRLLVERKKLIAQTGRYRRLQEAKNFWDAQHPGSEEPIEDILYRLAVVERFWPAKIAREVGFITQGETDKGKIAVATVAVTRMLHACGIDVKAYRQRQMRIWAKTGGETTKSKHSDRITAAIQQLTGETDLIKGVDQLFKQYKTKTAVKNALGLNYAEFTRFLSDHSITYIKAVGRTKRLLKFVETNRNAVLAAYSQHTAPLSQQEQATIEALYQPTSQNVTLTTHGIIAADLFKRGITPTEVTKERIRQYHVQALRKLGILPPSNASTP